jgi:phage portal protein BeeE
VPAQLIGIPDAQTYANMEQARLAFWEDTVLPLVRLIQDGLSDWLLPQWEAGLRFAPDEDAIPALVDRRHALFEKLGKAEFLTLNERRAAAGYPPLPGGDQLG